MKQEYIGYFEFNPRNFVLISFLQNESVADKKMNNLVFSAVKNGIETMVKNAGITNFHERLCRNVEVSRLPDNAELWFIKFLYDLPIQS